MTNASDKEITICFFQITLCVLLDDLHDMKFKLNFLLKGKIVKRTASLF